MINYDRAIGDGLFVVMMDTEDFIIWGEKRQKYCYALIARQNWSQNIIKTNLTHPSQKK